LARIVKYVRANGDCPADEFLCGVGQKAFKRVAGQFDVLTKIGADYCNHERFHPLHGYGKPLWEFKEFDLRLYCSRRVIPPKTIEIVLFSGWVKQKRGKTKKEDRQITRAVALYNEFVVENQGGSK
jgi:hypothetical protein